MYHDVYQGLPMAEQEKARVFKNGRSQAVRIPAEYRFQSAEVYIRRNPQNGEVILSERPQRPSLNEIFAMMDSAGGAQDLLPDRDTTPPQERDWM
jgi:antitoxin VapB